MNPKSEKNPSVTARLAAPEPSVAEQPHVAAAAPGRGAPTTRRRRAARPRARSRRASPATAIRDAAPRSATTPAARCRRSTARAPPGPASARVGSREFGTNQIAPATAAITIGTFTRNTDPHEKCSRSQPPEMGPSATPTPVTAVQIADRGGALLGVGEDVHRDRQRGAGRSAPRRHP